MAIKKLTESWVRILNEFRYRQWNLCGPSEPVMPWLPPYTPGCLARVLRNTGASLILPANTQLGSQIDFDAHELSAETYQDGNYLFFVRRGLVAQTSSVTVQNASSSIALTPAGRVIGGGLDFYFCHPFMNQRYTLTETELLVCKKDLLMAVLAAEPALQATLYQYFELCHLSTVITLEATANLSAEDRLRLYLLSWAVYWGVLMKDDSGTEWVKIPVPLLRDYIARVISVSKASVDKSFMTWQKNHLIYDDNPYLYVQASLLVDLLQWVCMFDDMRSSYRNNLTLTDVMPRANMA